MDRVKGFVFRGILASNAVAQLRALGSLQTPAHTIQERQDDDMLVSVPAVIRGAAIEMQRTYRLLYVFENLVRNFIDQRFTEVDKRPDWWDAQSTAEMKKKLLDRRQLEERNSWHPGRSDSPLFYIDFGDLALLIINHWAVFKDESGLSYKLGAMHTTIEGDSDRVMDVILRCHRRMLELAPRVLTSITIDDRRGATGRLEGKVRDVEQVLGKPLSRV